MLLSCSHLSGRCEHWLFGLSYLWTNQPVSPQRPISPSHSVTCLHSQQCRVKPAVSVNGLCLLTRPSRHRPQKSRRQPGTRMPCRAPCQRRMRCLLRSLRITPPAYRHEDDCQHAEHPAEHEAQREATDCAHASITTVSALVPRMRGERYGMNRTSPPFSNRILWPPFAL